MKTELRMQLHNFTKLQQDSEPVASNIPLYQSWNFIYSYKYFTSILIYLAHRTWHKACTVLLVTVLHCVHRERRQPVTKQTQKTYKNQEDLQDQSVLASLLGRWEVYSHEYYSPRHKEETLVPGHPRPAHPLWGWLYSSFAHEDSGLGPGEQMGNILWDV